ncbi:MAG: hypothetical protein ACR2IR_04385 [Acidimicrobiia bacterium]
MSKEFFEQVVDALVGFLPPDGRDFSWRTSSRNAKVWFGDETREHYEVQLVDDELEIGFHAEHPDPARNDAVLKRILGAQAKWRRRLGDGVETGEYLGRQARVWRRASECWEGDGLLEPGTAVEAAERLAAYITTIEPIRA